MGGRERIHMGTGWALDGHWAGAGRLREGHREDVTSAVRIGPEGDLGGLTPGLNPSYHGMRHFPGHNVLFSLERRH